MAETAILERTVVVRDERRLEYFTVAWNAIEGLVTVAMDVIAGSISLAGFGFDRKRANFCRFPCFFPSANELAPVH